MTAQEIFQNMTKGEWKQSKRGFNVMGGNDEPIAKCFTTEEAAGIVSAVNNTYGRGINPESVEKMKGVLEKLEEMIEGRQMHTNWALQKIKEALTSSKL